MPPFTKLGTCLHPLRQGTIETLPQAVFVCDTFTMTSLSLQLIASILYFGTTYLAMEQVRHQRRGLSAMVLGLIAVDLHAVGYAWHSWGAGAPNLHFFAALSLVGMVMAAVSLLQSIKQQATALQIVIMPIAGICAIPFALQTPPLQPIALDWRIQAHVWLALFSYAALSVATITALMLAAQERRLRQRRALVAQSVLPPLIQIESLLFRLLQAAFLLLTLTLLSGALFIEDLFAQHLVHKTVLSILSWIVLGVLLAGRYRYGWRGRKAVRLTLLSMGLLLLAFFGSKLVIELILQRH